MNLPTETWSSILRFACEDDIDLEANFGPRWGEDRLTMCGQPKRKLPYSLVSRGFQRMMEHILYECVWINRSTSAAQLADFFDRAHARMDPQNVGARTRVLVLDYSIDEMNTGDFENFCISALRLLCHCQKLRAFSLYFTDIEEEWQAFGTFLRIHRMFRAEAATLIPATVTHLGWKEHTHWDASEPCAWLATMLARPRNLRLLVFVMSANKDYEIIPRIALRHDCLTHLHISACLDDLWFIDTWELPTLQDLVLTGTVVWFDENHVVPYQERPSLRSLTLIETEQDDEYIALAPTIAPDLTELGYTLPDLSSNWTQPYRLQTIKIEMGRLAHLRVQYDNYDAFERELVNYFDRLLLAHSPALRHILLHTWPVRADDLVIGVIESLLDAFEGNETVHWTFEGFVINQ